MVIKVSFLYPREYHIKNKHPNNQPLNKRKHSHFLFKIIIKNANKNTEKKYNDPHSQLPIKTFSGNKCVIFIRNFIIKDFNLFCKNISIVKNNISPAAEDFLP